MRGIGNGPHGLHQQNGLPRSLQPTHNRICHFVNMGQLSPVYAWISGAEIER